MAAPYHKRFGEDGTTLTGAFTTTAADGAVQPVVLPNGTTVVLRLREETAVVPLADIAATIVNPAQTQPADANAGEVTYAWPVGQDPVATDPAEPVQFRFRFVATLPGGGVLSTPARGDEVLVVHPSSP